jgi:hypothetical protein
MRVPFLVVIMGIFLFVGCGEEEKVEPPKAPIPPSPPAEPVGEGEDGQGVSDPSSQTPTKEPGASELKDLPDEALSASEEVVGEKAVEEKAEDQGEADGPVSKGEPDVPASPEANKESKEEKGAEPPETEEAKSELDSEMEGDGTAGNELGAMSSLKDCTEALDALVNNAKVLGLQEPNDTEKEEFLVQCSEWPTESAMCLAAAEAPNEVLECMKPIAKHELEKSRERAIQEGDDLEQILNERIKKRK